MPTSALFLKTVFHWLDKDDMKISKCYELFDTCGYTIKFSMVPKSEGVIDCTAVVNMVTEDAPSPDDRRLGFMARAIAKTNMTHEELAKALGMMVTIDIQPKGK